jgi:hypothetical protein
MSHKSRSVRTSAYVLWIAAIAIADTQTLVGQVNITLGPASFRIANEKGPNGGFGAITDALFTSNGVVVLDGRNAVLQVVDRLGVAQRSIGRMGSGPGEMREGTSITRIGRDTLVLYDRALLRLSYFSHMGSNLKLLKTVRMQESGTEDLCTLRGKLIAFGYSSRTGRILHKVSGSGQRLEAFGDTLFSGGPSVNSVATSGQILCLEEKGLVLVAPYLKGEILAYNESGRLAWRTVLADYVPVLVKLVAGERGRGTGVLMGKPPGHTMTHKTVGIHRLSERFILVQTAVTSRENPGFDFDFVRVESRILRLSDGVEVARRTDLPFIIAVENGKALCAGGEPELWLESRPYAITSP